MFCIPLTAVINFESRYFFIFFIFFISNKAGHSRLSFLPKIKQIRFQLTRGTSVIGEIERSVRKNHIIENSVLYFFFE